MWSDLHFRHTVRFWFRCGVDVFWATTVTCEIRGCIVCVRTPGCVLPELTYMGTVRPLDPVGRGRLPADGRHQRLQRQECEDGRLRRLHCVAQRCTLQFTEVNLPEVTRSEARPF